MIGADGDTPRSCFAFCSSVPPNCSVYARKRTGGYAAPSNRENGTHPADEDDFPVNFVSAADAEAYCAWLTDKDGVNTYRLPNESEWELAAGHMPKDADFNCGVNDGRTSVEECATVTRGAHGAGALPVLIPKQ